MAQSSSCDLKYTQFTWEVKYPFLLTDCDICSPNFSIDSFGVTRYYLHFCSETTNGICNVSLHIKKHEWNCDPSTITLDLKMSITGNTMNEEYHLKGIDFTENSKTLFEKKISISCVKDLSMESQVLFCFEIEPNVNSVADFWACNHEDLESLSSDIGNSLSNEHFSDLTVKSSDGKPVRLNKTIFAHRYSTLAELFKNPRQELCPGITKEVFSTLLNYLYSGKINIGCSNYELIELLNKAELYHLQHILYLEPRNVYAATSVPMKYASFVWVIPKFSELENDTYIDNYLCSDPLVSWTRLRIQFYIGENADGERCIMFRLQRIKEDGKLFVCCSISVVAEEEYNKSYKLKFECQRELIIPSFIKVAKIQEKRDCFLINDTLKLRFEFVLSNLEISSRYESVKCLHVERGKFPSIVSNLWALRKDIAGLFQNSQLSDISIQYESLLIPAHKVILCARSPYFSRILEDDIEGNSVFINTYDRTIVMDILSYIYSGDVKTESKSFEWAINLYRAAKEFEIEKLRQKCYWYISEHINAENVFILLNKL